jgi:hypothetical protein
LLGLLLVAPGCAGSAPGAKGAGEGAGAPDDWPTIARFETLEGEILGDLAALDRRLARRMRTEPREEDERRVGMAAVLEEDTSIVLDADGRSVDPFSFAARGRGLEAVRAKLARLPQRLPATPRQDGSSPMLERELLVRLVEEEALRLDAERSLPRSASALVRALVATWRMPAGPIDAEKRDRDVARRLRELRASLELAPLDVHRARDLDDALDALEHRVDAPAFRASTAELARLREALEAASHARAPNAPGMGAWSDVQPLLRAYLGVTEGPADIDRRLAAAEARARAIALAAQAKVSLSRDDMTTRLEPLLFAEALCLDVVPSTRVRSMAAPPEREPACHLRHAAAGTINIDATTEALVATALHDHVIVARWALAVASGAETLERARSSHHLMAPPSAGLTARLERTALVRPVAAIGAGLTVALLVDDGANPYFRAKDLSSLGDVPLDVAVRLLARD